MAIIVTCQCGKQLRAKDEHAGMQATCPNCRKLILIPGTALAKALSPSDSVSASSLPPGMPPLPDGTYSLARQPVGTRIFSTKLFVLAVLTAVLGIYAFSWFFGSKSISAERLSADWRNDRDAFLTNYVGKTLVITGQISGYAEPQQNIGITLDTDGKPQVVCFLQPEALISDKGCPELRPGTWVSIKGKCRNSDYLGTVIYFDDCIVLSPKPTRDSSTFHQLKDAQEAAKRAGSINNLKQIGLAMHNYHDANKHFPAASTYSSDGKPLLSWRVMILPMMEYAQLFDQFHLNEPWDSPHNRKLIDKMPVEYRSPASISKGPKSNYVVPVGPGTVFEARNGMNIRNITDGTAHTIMAVEVDDAHAVIWTKPDDLPYNPNEPFKGLGGLYKNIFQALFCDGSVRSLKLSLPDNWLRSIFSANGGEPAPNFDTDEIGEKRPTENLAVEKKPIEIAPQTRSNQPAPSISQEDAQRIVTEYLEKEANPRQKLTHYKWSKIAAIKFDRHILQVDINPGDVLPAIYHSYRYYDDLGDGKIGTIGPVLGRTFYIRDGQVLMSTRE